MLSFVLCDLFSVSESRVSQTVITWINLMHCFQSMHQSAIKGENYHSRKVFLRQQESLIAQICSYRNQNHIRHKVEHINHITPLNSQCIIPTAAFFIISDLWGGNTSDRFITEHSGFLDQISPGDEIMADRGFTIRDLLTERRATLVIPPFIKKCKWGKGIAKHVERAIRRLNNFRILSQVMDIKYS